MDEAMDVWLDRYIDRQAGRQTGMFLVEPKKTTEQRKSCTQIGWSYQQTKGVNSAGTIDVTRPNRHTTTTETRIAYDNSTWRAIYNTGYINDSTKQTFSNNDNAQRVPTTDLKITG